MNGTGDTITGSEQGVLLYEEGTVCHDKFNNHSANAICKGKGSVNAICMGSVSRLTGLLAQSWKGNTIFTINLFGKFCSVSKMAKDCTVHHQNADFCHCCNQIKRCG